MDLKHSGSNKLFAVHCDPHGHAIAGKDLSFYSALFARQVTSPTVYETGVPPAIRLHLELPGLYDALRWLVLAGPGHTVKMYCCEFWFGDKCDVHSGEFEVWDRKLERNVRRESPDAPAVVKDCQGCQQCGRMLC
jgi:hypothetical protein